MTDDRLDRMIDQSSYKSQPRPHIWYKGRSYSIPYPDGMHGGHTVSPHYPNGRVVMQYPLHTPVAWPFINLPVTVAVRVSLSTVTPWANPGVVDVAGIVAIEAIRFSFGVRHLRTRGFYDNRRCRAFESVSARVTGAEVLTVITPRKHFNQNADVNLRAVQVERVIKYLNYKKNVAVGAVFQTRRSNGSIL